jgi:hypothetical protein
MALSEPARGMLYNPVSPGIISPLIVMFSSFRADSVYTAITPGFTGGYSRMALSEPARGMLHNPVSPVVIQIWLFQSRPYF